MKHDLLKQYAKLRQQLTEEKEAIGARLAEIDFVLNGQAGSVKPAKVKATVKTARTRPSNELSLKEAILQVVKDTPLTRQEVFAAITKLGYKFSAKDPLNSINTVLYGKKPKFKKKDGKFSV